MDGHLMFVWDSLSDAARSLNLSKSGITRAASGDRSHCGKYRWVRSDNPSEDIGPLYDKHVYGIMLAGLEYLGRWHSIRAAARDLDVDSALISKIIRGERFQWKGVMFVWSDSVDDAKVRCINNATARIK